jgi:hypothetical protein
VRLDRYRNSAPHGPYGTRVADDFGTAYGWFRGQAGCVGGPFQIQRLRNDAVSAAAVRVSERAEHYLCIKGRLSGGTNLIVRSGG